MSTQSIHLADAAATRECGAALARALLAMGEPQPMRIALRGELGAGKTTLVAGLLGALGARGPVRSPTYTLIEPYELAGREFYHCDLYRIETEAAIEELGLRDLLIGGTVLLVEWPERAGARLEPWDLNLQLDYAAGGRRLELRPATAAGAQLLAGLALDQLS